MSILSGLSEGSRTFLLTELPYGLQLERVLNDRTISNDQSIHEKVHTRRIVYICDIASPQAAQRRIGEIAEGIHAFKRWRRAFRGNPHILQYEVDQLGQSVDTSFRTAGGCQSGMRVFKKVHQLVSDPLAQLYLERRLHGDRLKSVQKLPQANGYVVIEIGIRKHDRALP